MDTPIYDFVRDYARSGVRRLHVPGHKGVPSPLGCEALDITEVQGADVLHAASGIIARSEENAAALFGSGKTFYSTEGSSHCIRAMVWLALLARGAGTPPVIAAARNVHSAFVSAAALCGAEPLWLWPERRDSLCRCEITPQVLDRALARAGGGVAAVYITSPDYLGNLADIPGLSAVCRKYGRPLLVDNAHGAYLKFLPRSLHPLDLGADMCCDSAHKTLPVLTGGAWLHIAPGAPPAFSENARRALALFGSTSPSYLTLCSLDLCCAALAGDYPARLADTVGALEALRGTLAGQGWTVDGSDPARLTLRGDGPEIAARLRRGGVEPEYVDPDFAVLMATPDNSPGDLAQLAAALGECTLPPRALPRLPLGRCERVCSPRQALFAPQETVPVAAAPGRVCGAPAVSCPPAVPIAISGERIGPEALALLEYYGVPDLCVLRSDCGPDAGGLWMADPGEASY